MKHRLTILLMFVLPVFSIGQEVQSVLKNKIVRYQIKPIIGLQLWSTYTMGAALYNDSAQQYEPVTNRFNTQLRRSRIGLKGHPLPNLKFNFTAALDLVGRDLLSGTEGGANNGASPSFRIWNAYLQWRVFNESEALHVTGGYTTVPVGRENITSALRSTSMEKSWSQNYLRRHLTGTGPGRTMGIQVGGLLLQEKGPISFGYDAGIFNPLFQSLDGNSTGTKASPLLAGRAVVYLGDPEFSEYSIGHKVNFFGKRRGLSLGVSAARQGATDLFVNNSAAGVDMLFNWKNFNLDGEWTLLQRKGISSKPGVQEVVTRSQTGYLRLSYNIALKNKFILEPVIMAMAFQGEMEAEAQARASELKTLSGEDRSLDIGINLYPRKEIKISLHYTLRQGDLGDANEGAAINDYFYQSGVGAIHRGDWLGLGIVMVL